jgi:predicted DCC family thiol-disulfide oxidoreductase YuxK
MPETLRLTLLWDGECGFCRRLVKLLMRLTDGSLKDMPYQVASGLPQGVARVSNRQMHWVDHDLHVHGGSAALIQVLMRSKLSALGALLGAAPFRPFVWLGYRLVASNRLVIGRLAGAECSIVRAPTVKGRPPRDDSEASQV